MYLKHYRLNPLIITVFVLTWIVDYFVREFGFVLSNQEITLPSTFSIVGCIIVFYDKFLWKFPVFNMLTGIPDMSGRYKGRISYQLNGVERVKECCVEIMQTASKIKIETYFSNSNNENTFSESLVEEIKKSDGGFFDIFFIYKNTVENHNNELDSHEGVNILRYHQATKEHASKLRGRYFTNRVKQTKGIIEVTFESKDLIGRFN